MAWEKHRGKNTPKKKKRLTGARVERVNVKLGAATCAADKVPSVWQIAVTHIAGDVALEQRRRGIAGKNRGDIRGQKKSFVVTRDRDAGARWAALNNNNSKACYGMRVGEKWENAPFKQAKSWFGVYSRTRPAVGGGRRGPGALGPG